jgi:hypothetical protein
MGSRNSTTIPGRLVKPQRLTVNTAGTGVVQGPNLQCHGVVVRALCPGQTIYLGTDNTVTTATGHPMVDGEEKQFEITNVNQLWFVSSLDGQAVSFFPYRWV